ncbi:MAG: TIGR01244 family sulfur transferase [Rhizobiaceae bacterium]|nr:TIGR01244 family sulfur transferase [Rhizobiaceae bacterium]
MRQVSDKLYIAAQPTAADFEHACAIGIINNRTAGEEPAQPDIAASRATAEAQGLAYWHIPVVPGQIALEQVRAFQAALASVNGPVLAHCKTGTRSASLHAIGEVLDGRMGKDEVVPFGRTLGLDLSGAVRWLDANAAA